MESLPDELKLELLYDVGYPGLVSLCQSNQEFANLCRDEVLWRRLFERDFPNLEPPEGIDWRTSYINTWDWYHSIREFAESFLQNHPFVKRKYVQLEPMIQDLIDLIDKFLDAHYDSRRYSYEDLHDLAYDTIKIASGLRDRYIGDGNERYDIGAFSWRSDREIYDFLRSIDYHMNPEDVETYEFNED